MNFFWYRRIFVLFRFLNNKDKSIKKLDFFTFPKSLHVSSAETFKFDFFFYNAVFDFN